MMRRCHSLAARSDDRRISSSCIAFALDSEASTERCSSSASTREAKPNGSDSHSRISASAACIAERANSPFSSLSMIIVVARSTTDAFGCVVAEIRIVRAVRSASISGDVSSPVVRRIPSWTIQDRSAAASNFRSASIAASSRCRSLALASARAVAVASHASLALLLAAAASASALSASARDVHAMIAAAPVPSAEMIEIKSAAASMACTLSGVVA